MAQLYELWKSQLWQRSLCTSREFDQVLCYSLPALIKLYRLIGIFVFHACASILYIRGLSGIFYISMQTYVVVSHLKCLAEALLISTHNMFAWRNKKKYQQFCHFKQKGSIAELLGFFFSFLQADMWVLIRSASLRHF